MNIAKRTIITAAGALVVAVNVLMSTSVWAANTNISAEAVCAPDGGAATINYTSWSFERSDRGSNPEIQISFNSIVVGTGAYEDPDWAFSGSALTTEAGGATVIVTALAVGDWGVPPIIAGPGGQTSSTSVTVPEDCTGPKVTGRFTGGGVQTNTEGKRVTYGLTIHCDLQLSNNLELNWRGNRFHMTEHLITTICSDNPEIIQAPPVAPIDTLVGVGTGRYNNEDGYTIEFTLQDHGEPGIYDQAAFKIYETANELNVVLEVLLQTLDGGNLQAHADQPHKRNVVQAPQ